MIGYVYKITNKLNNKFYIGQTSGTVEARWKKHVYESTTNKIDTKFSRAIRKYGENSFIYEILETVQYTEVAQLTDREYFWIETTNAIKLGYNCAKSKDRCGGNTYFGRTATEMIETRQKLHQSKLSAKNPNATAIKLRNVDTLEVLHFGCVEDACKYFNEPNHITFCRRYNNVIKGLYKHVWQVVRETDTFPDSFVRKSKHPRAKTVYIIDTLTNVTYTFESCVECEAKLGIPRKRLPGIAYRTHSNKGQYKNYLFELI